MSDLVGKVSQSDSLVQRLRSFERAVESARNGIVITDPSQPDNPIIYANRAFFDISGYSSEEVVGRNCRFLQGEDRDQAGLDTIRESLRTGTACVALLRNYRKDGTLFWNELYISPVEDESGKLVNFVGIQNDVSDRKAAEKRVSEFYAMISHELRTPLTSILASLGLVVEGDAGDTSKQVNRLVSIALGNTERLLKLVDDVLDLKKMEAGRLDLKIVDLDAEVVIDEVIASMHNLATARGITLAKGIDSKYPFAGDSARVAQIFTNLIGNAVKFSPPDTTVLIEAKHEPGYMRFSVCDHGPGIAEKDFHKLFGKFQQLDSSDTRAHAGTGLGLAISKMLVELQGGEIGFSSQPEQGSTFWFTLPLVKGKATTPVSST